MTSPDSMAFRTSSFTPLLSDNSSRDMFCLSLMSLIFFAKSSFVIIFTHLFEFTLKTI
ncbi:hypothetical protein [Methanobrevibacter sp.]|uniref:hypothetical protein n=1 Tax=Methanobrevibacter sp. TaxID=66852 RepID=UPI0038637AB9